LYDVLCGTSYTQAIAALEKDGRAVDNLPGFIGLDHFAPHSCCNRLTLSYISI